MKISEFIAEMDNLYPKSLSAAWDTDGLQCCADPDKELKSVLVALDSGNDEINRAAGGGYDLLLTHHPLIFGSAGYIVRENPTGDKLLKLISAGCAAASFHTRLDAGEGGVNDCLANMIGLDDIVPFGDDEMPSGGRIGMLTDAVDAVGFAAALKEKLGSDFVRLTGDGTVKRVAVVGGAGKDFILPAIAAGADAIVTGEASYSAASGNTCRGIVVIEASHYYTEFPVCRRLAELARDIAGAHVDIYDNCPQRTF